MQKHCEICGAVYDAYRSNNKYCKECRKISNTLRIKERRQSEAFRERGRKESRSWYQRHRVPKLCATCGVELPTNSQTWCFECLLKDWQSKNIETHNKARRRLGSRGYDKHMIRYEIEIRRKSNEQN